MRILSIQIENYKSFLDTGSIALDTGINIITGKNNAGKSAFLECLGMRLEPDKTHKTSSAIPSRIGSTVSARIRVSRDEATEWIRLSGARRLFAQYDKADRSARRATAEWINNGYLDFYITCHSDGSVICHLSTSLSKSGQARYETDAFGNVEFREHSEADSSGHDLLLLLGESARRQIYRFKAERMHIGEHEFGVNKNLEPDARNLPMVLNNLQTANPERYRRFNCLVTLIFPEIKLITTRSLPNSKVEILVWNHDPRSEREDLAIRLTESGTGISQVLAMLYVLITANEPRVIIIDEPNSFLHPGAIRTLMSVFQDHNTHQYVISTHSPAIISNSRPGLIYLLKKKTDAQTEFEKIGNDKSQQLRDCLIELGAGLSEIYGAESVLWVEGRTEEICFPLILAGIGRKQLGSVAIAGVKSTSEFDKRNIRHTFEIYEKLTASTAIVPPAIGYIFDREGKDERELADLAAHMNGRGYFLARRCYENYLLHPGAIQHVLSNTNSFIGSGINIAIISDWLGKNGSNFSKGIQMSSSLEDWRKQVDAPKLLKALFQELSSNREAFNKTVHSVSMTEWLIRNHPEELAELSELIARALKLPS